MGKKPVLRQNLVLQILLVPFNSATWQSHTNETLQELYAYEEDKSVGRLGMGEWGVSKNENPLQKKLIIIIITKPQKRLLFWLGVYVVGTQGISLFFLFIKSFE